MNSCRKRARTQCLSAIIAAGTIVLVVNHDVHGDLRVSDPSLRAYQAAWSPDGTRLAYLGDTDGQFTFGLYVTDEDGANHTLLVAPDDPLRPLRGLAWSANGIYYIAADREVYRIQPDGSGAERLTFNDSALRFPIDFVDVTADGSKMVFVADQGSSGWYDVFSAPTDGSGNQCMLNPGSGHANDFSLGISESVYYATAPGPQSPHTISIDVNCSAPDQVTDIVNNPLGTAMEYVISPDGAKLVYSAGSTGARILMVGDAVGSNSFPIADVGDNCFGNLIPDHRILPRPRDVWTADSQWLFYASNNQGSYDLLVVSADGTIRANVATDPLADEYVPALSPTDSALAYIKDDGVGRELYVKTLGLTMDCNGNSVIDVNDIAYGTSVDCNSDGYPDECLTIDFHEDWENRVSLLPDWISECDAPVCASINASDGNPGQCLNVGGTFGGTGTTSILYHDMLRPSYDCGLTIEVDAWLSAAGSHFTDVFFGLWQDETPQIGESSGWAVMMWFNKGAGNERNINMAIYSPDPEHDESSGFVPAAYASEAWNTGRIEIRPDGYVEFYVKKPTDDDFVHLWTTSKTIDPNFSGKGAFVITGKEGNGPARVDNVLIAESAWCDCNDNGVPDECDITGGTSTDCNLNSIPDECDIAGGTSDDCNLNDLPDSCEPDFDSDGTIDDCDPDIDNDGVLNDPDVCDYTPLSLPRPFVEPDGSVRGDLDDDCDVDLFDFAMMQERFTGPND